MRLILIDNFSGFIWADTADLPGFDASETRIADAAMDAARLTDLQAGEYGRGYAFQRANPRDTRTGYHVYRVDVGGSEAVPVVADGQDSATIEAVMSDGEYVGFVTCADPSEED